MSVYPPKIDRRSYADIVRQILGNAESGGLRHYYTPDWKGRRSEDPGVVLTNLFANLMEIIIDRLNQVPDKHFFTFLDINGVERLPGNPARAPQTFTLAQGSSTGSQVPKGTQVATVQTEDSAALVFETERSMFVTPARLSKLFSVYPAQDRYGDHSSLIRGEDQAPITIFSPDSKAQFEHAFYIGHGTLFGYDIPVDITLKIKTKKNVSIPDANWQIEWQATMNGQTSVLPVIDLTDQLRTAGSGSTLVLPNVAGIEKTEIDKVETHWICAKLSRPLAPGLELPEIDTLSINAQSSSIAYRRQLDRGFLNNNPLDIQKDFYPFGTTPFFNDTFYFANKEVFSQKGQDITIGVTLSESQLVPNTGYVKLVWEYFHQENDTGGEWRLLGKSSNAAGSLSPPGEFGFFDGTLALTIPAKTGTIGFTCPQHMAPAQVNGVENFWLRMRIIDGNYGEAAEFLPASPPGLPIYIPETYQPPVIEKFNLDYRIAPIETAAKYAKSFNRLSFTDHMDQGQLQAPFHPFTSVEDDQEALYLGFEGVDAEFTDQSISIYWAVEEKLSLADNSDESDTGVPSGGTGPLVLVWEYYTSDGKWVPLEVRDETLNFTNRGTVTFIGPSGFIRTRKFGHNLFWMRARLKSGGFDEAPRLKGVYLNTTWVKNTETITNEIIGSSNGEKDQRFTFSRKPVLQGEMIYVREPEVPSEEDIAALADDEEQRLYQEEGRSLQPVDRDSLVKPITNELTGEEETWVRWHKIDNFFRSTPKSRHYVLNRIDGVVSFGDDQNGMIPPFGKDNIKAFYYQTGGGEEANSIAAQNAITELKTSLPYIDSTSNFEKPAGGSDSESIPRVKIRGPQTIKHRNLSVTSEDFVWLALESTTRIKKAICLPTTNSRLEFEPGAVTVIILPDSDEPKPLPTIELARHVKNYIEERCLTTIVGRIYVIGPGYLSISVLADVIPADRDQAGMIEGRIVNRLNRFFHPIHGGPEEKGWEFGRSVYISEVYSVIEGTAGVDFVSSVILNNDASLEEVPLDKHSLVNSGSHDIRMQ